MDVSSRGLPPLLMDLSKGFSVGRLPHGHRPQPQALDMTKKPEWYHRQPQNCSPDLPSPYRTSSLHPDLNQDPGSFMNSPLTPGLDLYRDQVRSNLWHSGFYEQSGDAGPESSAGEEEEEDEEDSDSDSDVIFLVSSTKEPLLCTSFIQDNVTHIVEPLSPAVSSLEERQGFYHLPQTVSSPSRDSSFTEESSDSSVDIPINHPAPIVLLTDLRAVYANQSPAEASSDGDDSDVAEVPVSQRNIKLSKKTNKREARKMPRLRAKTRSKVQRKSSKTPPLSQRCSLRRQVKHNSVGLYNESYDSDDVLDFVVRSSSSDESIAPPKNFQRMSDKCNNDSTTEEKCPTRSPEKELPAQRNTVSRKYKRIGKKRKTTPAISKAKKLKVAKQNGIQLKGEDTVKVKTVTKRRRRKRKFKQSGPPSLFPPIEPEIALKYAYRKKRERKFDSFSPFVHVEKRACSVVNYHEEEEKAQSRPSASQDITGFVPTTSCYHLGRISSESKCDEFLKCSLCGQTANAKSLGDLHGPYLLAFLERPEARTMPNGQLENHTQEGGSEFQSKSPKVGEASEDGSVSLEECWVHEDCSVWSTGVFLVRGRLYGLKEAATLAQQTICSCCQEAGAIMGCFQKGCSRNFHFSCAVQSGCVLNEENFSMRCPDHKNKPCVNRPHLR